MIFEKFKQIKTDRMIKAMIGMSRDKFDQLALIFTSVCQAIQEERLLKKEIKRLPAGGRPRVFETPEERLFFILFYLKTYPTFDVLGFHFDLSAGHAHDYIEDTMPILKRALEQCQVYPKRNFTTADEFREAIEKYDEISIDGVEMPCVRPVDQDEQAERYSGKKKRHTIKSLALSAPDRFIVYISHLFGGHVHDYSLMKAEFDVSFLWFRAVTLFADLGFLGANKDYGPHSDIRLPHKKPRKSKNNPSPELSDIQKSENHAHSKRRVVVEHAIGGMKHFHCLTHRIRSQSISFMDQLLGLGAGLWNFKIV